MTSLLHVQAKQALLKELLQQQRDGLPAVGPNDDPGREGGPVGSAGAAAPGMQQQPAGCVRGYSGAVQAVRMVKPEALEAGEAQQPVEWYDPEMQKATAGLPEEQTVPRWVRMEIDHTDDEGRQLVGEVDVRRPLVAAPATPPCSPRVPRARLQARGAGSWW